MTEKKYTLSGIYDIPIKLCEPAVDMRSAFERMLPVSLEKYKRAGYAEMGFEHKLNVPYAFYTELCENDISQRNMQREMLIIHGGRADAVLPEHIRKFCAANPKAELEIIRSADHGIMGRKERGRAAELAERYITD